MAYSILTVLSQLLNPELNPVEVRIAESKAVIRARCSQFKEQGVVTQAIQPGELGRVRFQATTWAALCPYDMDLSVNTSVRIVGQYNATTLIVESILQIPPRISTIEHAS
jgi:membrane protein implicated in regulation of membrane protease activity